MKILLINTSDLNGGAAIAASRLNRGLQQIGTESQMLVQTKVGDDRSVVGASSKIQRGLANMRPTLDTLPLNFYRQRDRTPYNYSLQWLPNKVLPQINQINPDVINLHWICGGYLPIETIAKLDKPLVWTLHDMWAFTGGCHYTGDCTKYIQSCGKCPILQSNRERDFSRWIWQRKVKAWQNLNLTIVTPSKWLGERAQSSSLFAKQEIVVIPNGIDIQQYKPLDKQIAKNILGIPVNKTVVLFGASTANSYQRKGFTLLQSALQILSNSTSQTNEIELVIFGASEPNNAPNFGFPTRYMGRLNDTISLSLLYGAADVFVAPSIQDNFPNTIIEALACGTPCAAFKIGGMPDAIDHQQNGYLAQPFDPQDLAQGIEWILAKSDRHFLLCQQARSKVEQNFTLEIQAAKYLEVFQEKLLAFRS